METITSASEENTMIEFTGDLYEEGYWTLTRNAAICNHCGDTVESKHRHDFKWCSCGKMAVDGGLAYLKRVGDLANITEDCKFTQKSKEDVMGQIEYYEKMNSQYGSSWAKHIEAGKRLLVEWYPD